MNFRILVRGFRPEETEAIAALFTETVHAVNAKHYAPEQVFAWAPTPPDLASWRERLGGEAIVLVAEAENQILSFAAFTPDGHLDLLYTDRRFLRQGIGAALLRRIEDEARSRRIDRLFAEVSLSARSFFDHAGFRLITSQTVVRRGVQFVNYRMEKQL
jgi:putative acetyltransferase